MKPLRVSVTFSFWDIQCANPRSPMTSGDPNIWPSKYQFLLKSHSNLFPMVPFRDHQRRFEVSVSSFQFLGTLFWSHFYSNEGHKTIEVALFHLFFWTMMSWEERKKAEYLEVMMNPWQAVSIERMWSLFPRNPGWWTILLVPVCWMIHEKMTWKSVDVL